MTKNLKTKIAGFALLLGSTAALSACGGIPTCNEELNKCNRGGAYTEERTSEAGRYKGFVQPAVEEPAPVVQAAPEPAPEPAPVVVNDAPIMQSAEPKFTTISK